MYNMLSCECCISPQAVERRELVLISAAESEFLGMMAKLKEQREAEFDDIFVGLGDENIWFKVIEVEQDNSLLGVIIDVSKDVLEIRNLNYERDHDALTGIFNRGAFNRKSKAIFETGHMKCAAFAMFDLDNLKYINDTFGHEMGDLYIQTTALYMNKLSSSHVLVARMGGDEFYMLLHGFDTEAEIFEIVKDLHVDIQVNPLILPDGSKFTISISGGIAYYGTHSNDYNELLKYADLAMYVGKKSQKGQLLVYNSQMSEDE